MATGTPASTSHLRVGLAQTLIPSTWKMKADRWMSRYHVVIDYHYYLLFIGITATTTATMIVIISFHNMSFSFSLLFCFYLCFHFFISSFSQLSFSTSAFLSPFSDSLWVIFCMNKTWFDRHMAYVLSFTLFARPFVDEWMSKACLYGSFQSC